VALGGDPRPGPLNRAVGPGHDRICPRLLVNRVIELATRRWFPTLVRDHAVLVISALSPRALDGAGGALAINGNRVVRSLLDDRSPLTSSSAALPQVPRTQQPPGVGGSWPCCRAVSHLRDSWKGQCRCGKPSGTLRPGAA